MFYIKQSGNKIPHNNIPPGKKSSSVDWVSRIYSITKKFPTLCILFICPCFAGYPGCDSIINNEASCHSTSGGTQTMSIFFCWCTVILGISRKEMSLSLRSNFRNSQHCANRLITGRGQWVLFPLSQVEVDVWCHAEGVALGHNRDHGPPLESSCFPAWCSAQVLLFGAFCQCPEDGKSKNWSIEKESWWKTQNSSG